VSRFASDEVKAGRAKNGGGKANIFARQERLLAKKKVAGGGFNSASHSKEDNGRKKEGSGQSVSREIDRFTNLWLRGRREGVVIRERGPSEQEEGPKMT